MEHPEIEQYDEQVGMGERRVDFFESGVREILEDFMEFLEEQRN